VADSAPCTHICIQKHFRFEQFSCYSGTMLLPKFVTGLILRDFFLGSFNRNATYSYITGWQEGFNVRPRQLLSVSEFYIGQNFHYTEQILITLITSIIKFSYYGSWKPISFFSNRIHKIYATTNHITQNHTYIHT
jgi:hypothetical protein